MSYYNDSKATNVGAALAAIEGLGADIDGKLVLIAGGDGKGAEFKDLRDPVAANCRAVVLMGRDSDKIGEAIGDAVPLIRVGSLVEAVEQCRASSPAGRRGAAVAGLRQFRHVQELRRPWSPVRPRRGGSGMSLKDIIKPYPSPLITGRGIDLDFPMLAGCLALLGLGLIMIASASTEVAAVQSGSALYYMIRHLIYVVLGLGACIVTMMIPIATWQRLGWLMLLGAFGLLVMVIIPGIGREVNGSMRWIGFSFFNVQPSEIAKVFVVIYLAGYLVRRQKEVRESWMGFFKPFIVLLPMAGLLLMEPDFGATVVMMGAAAAMLFLGGVGLFRFSLMVVAGGRRGGVADSDAAVSNGASDQLCRPVGRPVRRRLSVVPGIDRLRSRRMAGRWPGQQRAETVLPAGSPH